MSRGPHALASGRIDGLDGWRAGLMIAGIALHASSWLGSRPLFATVELLSHTLRMGAFFAISGFAGARAMVGRSPGLWLRRRLIQIGMPTVFGLVVLCPLITATVAAMPGYHPRQLCNWYHLWFLVALLLYAPLAVLAEYADRRWALWRWLGRHYGDEGATLAPLLAGTGLLCMLLVLLNSIAIGRFVTAETKVFLDGCRSIASYWPDYLLGVAVARSPALQALMLRDWRSPTALLAMLGLAYASWFLLLAPHSDPGLRFWIDGALPLAGQAIAPPAAFALILRSSTRVRRLGPKMRVLADACFTVYIAHVPVIAALTLATVDVMAPAEVKYVGLALVTLALTLALHHWLVRHSTILSLVFCGKALARRAVWDDANATASAVHG